MNNCRNCGAPHNNQRCNYCGTVYGIDKIIYKPKPPPKTNILVQDQATKWYLKYFVYPLLAFILLGGFIILYKHVKTRK